MLLDLFLWFFGHDEAIGAAISSLRLSCHEIRAFLFKGYWYNLIHDLSFQGGTCDGTSMTNITNMRLTNNPDMIDKLVDCCNERLSLGKSYIKQLSVP